MNKFEILDRKSSCFDKSYVFENVSFIVLLNVLLASIIRDQNRTVRDIIPVATRNESGL